MSDEQLGRWPVAIEIPVAWGEMDAYGHVNHAVYLRWLESARIAYFERLGFFKESAGSLGPVVARIAVDYQSPVTYPDHVRVEVTALALGRTSITMGCRVRSERLRGALVAEGETVLVMVDRATGARVPLFGEFRAAVATLEESVM